MLVCAFTAVCEPDARWFVQYLAETDRLGLRFFVEAADRLYHDIYNETNRCRSRRHE